MPANLGHFRTLAMTLICAGAIAAGCSETVKPQPSVIERAEQQAPQVAVPAGFFGADEALLKPGNQQQAALVYINPNARWNQYDKVLLQPVEFWDSENSNVSPDDQQMLTSYFSNALKHDLQARNFALADRPGAGTMVLKVALVNATAATPGLRSISVVIPQARLLNAMQSLATGSYAFVGSAEAAGKISDSQSGQLLAAAVDQRYGGTALSAAAQWKWGDAENAMDLWAEKIAERLSNWRTGAATPGAGS